ncbi:MAG: J domain-containing protein [Alphaproteobacteria bacterium]|nr:J domain-containing protein [Alphaproteobacteria bacterium]
MNRRMKAVYEIETIYELLDELTYYQLLQLDSGCHQADIEPAFRQESRRLHPDRVARLGDTAFGAKANKVFRAVNEAYRTLKDPDARSAYDEEHASGAARLSDEGRRDARNAAATSADPELAARTEKGGKYWRMALQCWRDEDYNGCAMQIQFALSFEPDNEVFKEWQAKAKEKADKAKLNENPYKLRIV